MEKSLREEYLPFFWDRRLNLYDRYSSKLLREMLICVEAARETLERAVQKLTLPLQNRVYQVFRKFLLIVYFLFHCSSSEIFFTF